MSKRILKKLLKKSFFKPLHSAYKSYKFQKKLGVIQDAHEAALEKVRKKDKVKVAFFVIHASVWKYDKLFELMLMHPRFEPVVVVCPHSKTSDELMLDEINKCLALFNSKKYPCINTLREDGTWMNVKKELSPDVVFFTNPWRLTRDEYYINNYLDTLTCYVPYGFKCSHLSEAHYDKDFQNYLWKLFYETNINLKLAKKYARNKAINGVVTGFPSLDRVMGNNYKPSSQWKSFNKKKIIWAPHHSIERFGANLDYSTFLKYSKTMLLLAEKYSSEIEFVFKPHPMLKEKLYKTQEWGVDITDAYYCKWDDIENGQVVDSDYLSYFVTSDALIHDSGGFTVEYLFTNKPTLFLRRDINVNKRFNEIGKEALKCHYLADEESQIDKFIKKVVLGGDDEKKSLRKKFFESAIKPPNDISATENIFNHLNKELTQ